MIDRQQPLPYWRRIWVAVAVCFFLLSISLVPPVLATILYLDHGVTVALNELAGTSPVLDRLLLFVSDEDGHKRLLGLLLIYFIARTIMRRDPAMRTRDIGLALFLFLNCLIYLLIDGSIDDIIERESPARVLENFRNLNDLKDMDLDLDDERAWPCSEAAVLFLSGFVLLRRGRLRGGFIALAAGLVLPLGRVIAGLNWPTDIYLGALPVTYLLSAFMVETRLGRIENHLTYAVAAGFDQGRRYFLRFKPLIRNFPSFWRSQNVMTVEVATKRFIKHELPKVLKLNELDTATPPMVLVPLGGVRSIVRLISMGKYRVALRVYPLSRNFEAVQHVRALEMLNEQSVRAPRLLYYSLTSNTAGVAYVVEEQIDGKVLPVEELQPEHLDAVAETLSRLHRIRHQRWGAFEKTRTEDFASVLARRAERAVQEVARLTDVREFYDSTAQIQNWFARASQQFVDQREFRLIHSQLHRENALFETDGTYCLLDCSSLEWCLPAVDINSVHKSLCGGREDLINAFNEAYFQRIDPTTADEIRQTLPYFHALSILTQLLKSGKRRHHNNLNNSQKSAREYWNDLQEIMKTYNV